MVLKNFFLLVVFFVFTFSSNSFANLQFKQSKDISTDTDHLRGIFIKPDGTRLYTTEDTDDDQSVIEYSLSIPFDVSTATKLRKSPLTIGEGIMDNPHAIEFKPDGTEMYIIRSESAARVSIEQFTLSTPWDSSTLSWTSFKDIKTGCFTSVQARGLDFKPDGTRVFVASQGNKKVAHYDLTTPWDISTETNQICSSFDETNVRNIQLSSDGSTLYLGGNGDDDIKRYSLSTPYDVTTITLQATTFSISSQTGAMRGFQFSSNFTKLYVTGDPGTEEDDIIYEYDLECAGTITCSDPSNNSDVKAIIEANVELSKRIIKNNTLPIFHRIEWLRRHKNKDNLSNLNAEIDFTNEKISKLVSALKSSKKEIDRSYDSEDWFKWSEGRISLGKNKSINSSSRDFHSYGISVGADKIKDDDRDAMHGYVFQYANDNVDIGSSGTKLETDAYSFALYDTKLREDHFFTDALIGISLLDIDQKRVIYGNTLEGNREGQQIYGSFNFGKRIVDEDLNLNPGLKLDLGYTKLKAFRESTIAGDSLADALLYKEQNIKSALITLGVLLDKTDTDKEEDEIINHHGRLEYIADLSPSSDAEFYYLNSQSTVYNYNVENKSKHNLRIGYGFDVTSITGWSFVGNFERFQSNGKGHSNEIYLSVGYVPIDEMKFVFDLNNFENTNFSYTNNINGFDLKMSSNYNFISDVPDYGANIEISNKF